jgi:putative ABC transport system substrate-binding protein
MKLAIRQHPVIKLILCVILYALCPSAGAQQTGKVFRIGYLAGTDLVANKARVEALRQGLRDLGYVEGKNLAIELRYAEAKFERLPAFAAELVGLKVDVVVTSGASATRAAKEATKTIPIVMAQDSDPLGSGFIASLAHPGGNITGLSTLSPEVSGKRLELLTEIVPRLSRVAVFGTSAAVGGASGEYLRQTELAAGAFKVQLQYLDLQESKDIEVAFRAAKTAHADAALMFGGNVLNSHRTQIVELAATNRLPATYNGPEFVEAGGLMTYGASIPHLHYRAATYVDKILKGAKAADLPVEQPTKFELVINLKAAKQIGLTIPQGVLLKADRVIKERRQ